MCRLNARAGIHVANPNSLIIYGETNEWGMLDAGTTGGVVPTNSAAIGGNYKQDNGPITINSGHVGATSKGNGAAIGGGDQGCGVNITINGGNVVTFNVCSSESQGGAAIGGGMGTSTVPFTSGGTWRW